MLSLNQDGYITLISVLVIGAVGVALTVSVLTLGLSTSRSSFVFEQGKRANYAAEACAEKTLMMIYDGVSCIGDADIVFNDSICSSYVESSGETGCIIKATGTVGNVSKKIEVNLSAFDPSPVIDSWVNVAEF